MVAVCWGEPMNHKQPLKVLELLANFRNGIWLLGIPSWLFGVIDRTVAIFTDSYLSVLGIFHLLLACFFFVSWLYLKPEKALNNNYVYSLPSGQIDSGFDQHKVHLSTAHARMIELQEQHVISQEYILPFPYLCQIYHLLNLKHLETIHNFSLNNLKVIKVSHVQPTANGGMLKFQTILDSPFNALRIWRPAIVEVGLILHTPYTVELIIPAYKEKFLIVIFNALPLSPTEHKFFIDIYSNLEWPRPLLRILLHFASCLTLFEDLPYLRKLAARNLHRLVNLSRVSNPEAMWLFTRFVELYGVNIVNGPQIRSLGLQKLSLPAAN